MTEEREYTKEEKIKKEENRLKRALKDLDKNKLLVVESLIGTTAFMAVSLRELEEKINQNGYSDKYQNGENQFGTKQSDEVKTYLAMQKNFTTSIKTLADIAPLTVSKKSRLKELMGE